jgi:hypothetical protein
MATRKTITKKVLDAGGNRYEPIPMDYLKNSGTGHGPGIPLIYGHTRMPLSTLRKGLTY